MQISLDKRELEQFVQEQVAAGHFPSPMAVIEAGLARLMKDPTEAEFDAADLADFHNADQQIAQGEDLDWKEVSAGLRATYLGE